MNKKSRPKGEKANHWQGGKPKCSCGVLISYNAKLCKKCFYIEIKKNPFMKGFKHTEETRKKMSLARLGKKLSLETISKLKGKKAWNYIEDRTKLKKSEKKHLDYAYKDWMLVVKKRDNWKCKINNSACNGQLEAHHILNWIEYPELRYDINNGITLCHTHHPKGRVKEKLWSSYFMEIITSKI